MPSVPRRARLGRLALFAALVLCACDTTRVETVSSGITLRYLPGCSPGPFDTLTVEALGDFPPGAGTVRAFSALSGVGSLAGLPVDAALFRLRVATSTFDGFAIAKAADGRTLDALLLPQGVHCAVLDTGLPSLRHATYAQLPGGDVLVSGGSGESEGALARREAYRVNVAGGQVARDGAGMFLPRTLAAAVSVAEEAWVIGGAQSELAGSPALDSFERYDAAAGAFGAPGRLVQARVRPGAVRLLDGSVLVAGGERTVDGERLDAIERIAADGGSALLDVRLPWPARAPALLAGDDGLVWIAADVEGTLALARLDPELGAVAAVSPPAEGLEAGLVLALPGGRAALIEVRDGVTTSTLHVLLAEGGALAERDWLTPFSGLAEPRAHPLADGRILLTGAGPTGPVARVIDVGRGEVVARELDVLPSELVARDDGSVAEFAGGAVRVVREDARTPFDNPGGTVLQGDAPLALDALAHWERTGLSLVAQVAGARFELAGLAYQDVDVELAVDGAGELVVRRADGKERVLGVSPGSAGPVLCELSRADQGAVRFERRGESVRMVSGDATRTCRLDGMTGPVGLGFRALDRGTRVLTMTVTRR